ncbi:MAG: ATP-binding protein [SAR324 cluster bacterium]|nr:ATP-binding protein [SAR324 cluster bacterium]
MTILAKRKVSILSQPCLDEALEITKIHSISGNMHPDTPLIATRPS